MNQKDPSSVVVTYRCYKSRTCFLNFNDPSTERRSKLQLTVQLHSKALLQ